MSERKQLLNLARHFRKNPTSADAILWQKLRRRQFDDVTFRRQHIIGRYVVDFYRPAAHLVVEVDGDSHDFSTSPDAERDAFLEGQGYRVLRFTNEQMRKRMNDVLQTVYDATHGRWPDGDTRL